MPVLFVSVKSALSPTKANVAKKNNSSIKKKVLIEGTFVPNQAQLVILRTIFKLQGLGIHNQKEFVQMVSGNVTTQAGWL